MVVAAALASSPLHCLSQAAPTSSRISCCSLDLPTDNRGTSGLACLPLLSASKPKIGFLQPRKRNLSFTSTRASRNNQYGPSTNAVLPLVGFPSCSTISLLGQTQGFPGAQGRNDRFHLNRTSIPHYFGADIFQFHSSGGQNSYQCHTLLEGSGHVDALNPQAQDELSLPESESSSDNTSEELNTEVKSEVDESYSGRSGVASFYISEKEKSDQPSADQKTSRKGSWWVSSLWLLGPTVLVSLVVLPPFCLRKLFEMVLEDSLVTDFLILFFTETLFYVGVSIFLVIAHKVQQSTGVVSWKSDSYMSLGYKVSSVVTTIFGILLPVGAFAFVWPWTGPAAAAALFPYMAGLAVQYGFEHFVQDKKSSVWPLIPIVFQIYRLHQLNRATQLVAGLLYSLRGADATAETLAVNGSLQTLVSVLQLLGILCLWSLGAFLTHVFSTESQTWQSRLLSSGDVS